MSGTRHLPLRCNVQAQKRRARLSRSVTRAMLMEPDPKYKPDVWAALDRIGIRECLAGAIDKAVQAGILARLTPEEIAETL